MVTTVLVEEKIEEAKTLIRELQNTRLPISAAFWNYLVEPEEWRLVIASPLVDSKGPKAVYTRVNETIRKAPAWRRSVSYAGLGHQSEGPAGEGLE